MPQNEYIEEAIRRYGRRMDHDERQRKRTARAVHKNSAVAQKLHGLKAKLHNKKRHTEKIEMKKTFVFFPLFLLMRSTPCPPPPPADQLRVSIDDFWACSLTHLACDWFSLWGVDERTGSRHMKKRMPKQQRRKSLRVVPFRRTCWIGRHKTMPRSCPT